MKYDCYKQGISGAFEIDLNDPYESEEKTNNVHIDDVIAQLRERARRERLKQKVYNALGEASPDYSVKLAKESDWLADWLEELKAYRANEGMSENVYKMGYKFGYNRAMEEVAKKRENQL